MKNYEQEKDEAALKLFNWRDKNNILAFKSGYDNSYTKFEGQLMERDNMIAILKKGLLNIRGLHEELKCSCELMDTVAGDTLHEFNVYKKLMEWSESHE
jgi:hypothetical protein